MYTREVRKPITRSTFLASFRFAFIRVNPRLISLFLCNFLDFITLIVRSRLRFEANPPKSF
jgi:hypothetical protein